MSSNTKGYPLCCNYKGPGTHASGSPLQNTQRGTEGDIKLNSHQRHPLWKKKHVEGAGGGVGVNVLVELTTPRDLQ
ncbi:hypothetical protein E2320_013868, partial [Naja naja]